MRFHVKPIPASGTLRAPPATEALHRESARTADARSRRPAPQYRGSAVHGDRHSVAGRVPHATCVQEHSLTVARTYSIRACPTRRKTGRASDNAGLLTLDFLTPDLLPPESLRSGSTVRCNRAVQPCGAAVRCNTEVRWTETPPESHLTGDYAGEALDLVRARLPLFPAVNQAAHVSGLTFLPLLLACRVHGSEGVRPVSASSPLPGLAGRLDRGGLDCGGLDWRRPGPRRTHGTRPSSALEVGVPYPREAPLDATGCR